MINFNIVLNESEWYAIHPTTGEKTRLSTINHEKPSKKLLKDAKYVESLQKFLNRDYNIDGWGC